MEKTYVIRTHNAFGNETFREETDNHSSIIDKLLRITTKVTSSFASDILFPIAAFNEACENRTPYRVVIGFRESGADAKHMVMGKPNEVEYPWSCVNSYSQFWLLDYTPGVGSTLERVDVVEPSGYTRHGYLRSSSGKTYPCQYNPNTYEIKEIIGLPVDEMYGLLELLDANFERIGLANCMHEVYAEQYREQYGLDRATNRFVSCFVFNHNAVIEVSMNDEV